MFRLQRIVNQLALLQQTEEYEIKHICVNGIKSNEVWIVWIPGRKDTLWQGGLFPLTITLPKQYPKQPPIVTFDKDFQHIHVYEGGSICMPVVDSDYWKPGRTMREVLSRLDSFVHQPPNVYSPANEKMLKLFLEDEQEYARTIREQVKRYTTIHQKYLEMPCVHVFSSDLQIVYSAHTYR